MSSVASAVSLASSLTSLATTAKPLPASPARAASIVALSASRLVCSAIEVMTLMTLPISAEDSPSLAAPVAVRSAAAPASAATPAASLALRGDLADRGAHLLGAGRDRLDVGRDLLGRGRDGVGLRGGLSAAVPISELVAESSSELDASETDDPRIVRMAASVRSSVSFSAVPI